MLCFIIYTSTVLERLHFPFSKWRSIWRTMTWKNFILQPFICILWLHLHCKCMLIGSIFFADNILLVFIYIRFYMGPKNYIVNKYHSLIGIESKWEHHMCKILPLSCDISWSIKLFMLWPCGYSFWIKIVLFLSLAYIIFGSAGVGLTWFNDVNTKS